MTINALKKLLGFITTIIFLIPVDGFSQNREITTLQSGWRFSKDTLQQPVSVDFDDSNWQQITVPHDWAISGPFIIEGNGSTGKLPWIGQGWYRKQIEICKS